MTAGPTIRSRPPQEPSSVAATEVSIRLWTRDQLHRGAPGISWKSENPLVYMIADLVRASDGAVSDSGSALVARFRTAARALTAARRIQRGTHEFAQHRSENCFGVSIALHPPVGLQGVGNPSQQALSLEQAQPGQILVAPETYESLQSLPGLQFGAPTNPATQDRELIWTNSETYQWFRALLTRAQETASIADPAPIAKVCSTPTRIWAGTEAGEDGAFRGSAAAESTLLDELTEERSWIDRPILRRSLVVAVALLLVAACALILSPNLRKRAVGRQPEPPAVAEPPAGGAASTAPTGAEAPKPEVTRESSPPTVPPEVPRESSPPAVPPGVPEIPKTKQTTTPGEKKRPAEYEGFTTREIPQLLRRADEDAGAGKYDEARQEYGIVLKLEPDNATARQGLRRLELREQETRR